MTIEKKTGRRLPKPTIGKTVKDTQLVRFVDLNQYVDEIVDFSEGEFIVAPESPNNNEALIFNSTTQKWEAGIATDPSLQTVVVEVSSAEILNMGSSPVEILPVAGAGNYYDIEKAIFEYTYNGASYTLPASAYFSVNGGSAYSIITDILENTSTRAYIIKEFTIPSSSTSPGVQEMKPQPNQLNENCELGIGGPGNPTLGNGTLRVVIQYRIRTFGS